MSKDCVRITVRIPKKLHEAAVEMAQKQDRSLNWQIVNLMQQGALSLKGESSGRQSPAEKS
ncbi:MAG TPA: toxin-antitoxin system HicB family antitoxin [Noviherbaspirillum sp.]|nr:toxin-antitoxin system HicB family antitoxin [Noviherbaspirillum sp.]